MAKKTASKKTAARGKKTAARRKPRTAAQKRATARLVAMNKKKASAKKRSSRKRVAKKRATRARVSTPGRTFNPKRRRNPVTKRYVVALPAFMPGQTVYVHSYDVNKGSWVLDSNKNNAVRGPKAAMEGIAQSVIQQMPATRKANSVYLDPV